MKYPYHVKANGRYYAPGEEVEGNDAPESKREPEQNNPPPERPKGRRGKKSE